MSFLKPPLHRARHSRSLRSMQRAFLLLPVLLLAGSASAALGADTYASSIFQSSGLGTNPLYNDPRAALGMPTTLIDGALDNPPATYHASLVYAAYNTDPAGNNLLVALGSGGQGNVTVKFDTPLVHDAGHWYGQDFIVFGNSAFTGSGFVTSTTDMNTFRIASGNIYQNGTPTVSVSADGVSFTTLTPQTIFYPTNSYHWDGISANNPSGWGALSDFTKPVDPALASSQFANQTVAYAANTLYNGSAGGAAFSLAGTPFATSGVQYVRFSGTGNIDAVSRVGFNPAAVPEIGIVGQFAIGIFGGCFLLRRRRMERHKRAV